MRLWVLSLGSVTTTKRGSQPTGEQVTVATGVPDSITDAWHTKEQHRVSLDNDIGWWHQTPSSFVSLPLQVYSILEPNCLC